MTLTEVRDRLAELEGWTRCFATGSTKEDGEDGIYWKRKDRRTWDHPVEETLDEAAKLPEGWSWSCSWAMDVMRRFTCEAFGEGDKAHLYAFTEGPTELEARFRLRLACELATKEAP